ncbi:glutamyl-tRNA reductase [Archaeoglobus veneficus]|uniref:Glutamyl-tRNA reductase n=1 Tax=Archaeoglobus veneficus (strain DSM 11195 / SNP6) TaxID=693661 RepID=F2KQ96_ARCVS|nr:glutamyl-tRNA reductase [Archaeoglobus veneficus]AEA46529.1 Glutamyl-tRNA reductase [Archaeoglobus veneficus SNP6]
MEIANLVVSHKKASLEEIERAWHGDCRALIERVLSYPNITECAILMTCNRVEVYVVGSDTESTLRDFAKFMHVSERVMEIHRDDRCLEHLLRVASGLESMMVGEDQILGQVKDFYNLSKQFGGIGEVLDVVFSKAIQVGKKVRKLTGINKGSVSIGSAAVELAERSLGTLRGKKVLVVGAGEMGGLVAKALAHKECEILIANRTFSKAEKLAAEVGGKAVPFNKLERYIVESDVVITATSSPDYIITREMIERVIAVRGEGILLIDIAMPRDIEEDVAEIEGVELYTIEHLREISEENLRKRLKEAKKAEKIIAEELEHLKLMLKEMKADSAISAMYSRAEEVKKEEILELYNKLAAKYGIDESVLPILEEFANSFVKKFLRKPTIRLRKAARSGNVAIIEAAEYLFGGDELGVSKAQDEKTEERLAKTACPRK